ncbi:MAG: CGGC domain-containing protein [Dialister sp.]|nr:CGGC domain-containing protein [Dialister sp.]
MKRIVFLTCPKAESVCTGAACFAAMNRRTHAFARYKGEILETAAFMKCSGCGIFPGNDAGLDEKIGRILSVTPDAVHLGICTKRNGRGKDICEEVKAIAGIFQNKNIPVIRGTHSDF